MIEIEDRIAELVKNSMKDALVPQNNSQWPFLDIEDYRKKTGKRYRMTREQIESGMTREQAFQQFMEKLITKD